jgi:tRNA G10  N-methylase Trm11
MPKMYWYFKLFNSIKEEHEIDFAELEILGLFGPVQKNSNFTDILFSSPFKNFVEKTRIQDYLAHELPYGQCQGFYAEVESAKDISILIRRLGYTREFFIVMDEKESEPILAEVSSITTVDKNIQIFYENGFCLLRVITNQYFLEKSQYISKLSRNEKEVDKNVESLFSFLTKKLYRIPATSTMQVGKRLEDYFAIREEPSLYLTHYMHPYKGRFHPKMVRALLNYVYPKKQGLVMDNFAGCGTLLVEATWMGLDNIGIEINPLSVLMSSVKCQALTLQPEPLRKAIKSYLHELEGSLFSLEKQNKGYSQLLPPALDRADIDEQEKLIPKKIVENFGKETIEGFIIAKLLIEKVEDKKIRAFLLLTLSGSISDLDRRRSGKFLSVFSDRLEDLYLRVYTFFNINEILKIKLGESSTFCSDTRNMKDIVFDCTVDAIVNSPPYSTALDYIKNDFPQLTILSMPNLLNLKNCMIGNPNLSAYPITLFEEMKSSNEEYSQLPEEAKNIISALMRYGREKDALRSYKFFKDMRLTLKEMHRVMKRTSKCAIIIGNNNYKLDGTYQEVKNDDIIKKMAILVGFIEDLTIRRELEKSRAGNIRYESVIILQKV